MAQIMSERRMYMDTTSVDKHMKILDSIIRQSLGKTGHRYTTIDCEAKFFGQIGLLFMSRVNTPLHYKFGTSNVSVGLDIIVERSKLEMVITGGSGSERKQISKGISMFSNRNDYIVKINTLPDGYDTECYNKFNSAYSRANSIYEVLNRLETGGSTDLLVSTNRHMLLERAGRKDSNKVLCANLYMLLMKSILLYSTTDAVQMVTECEMDIYKVDRDMLILSTRDIDSLICVDNMLKDERRLLDMALRGHECVKVGIKGDVNAEDIFNKITFNKTRYMLCSMVEESRRYKHNSHILPPEKMLACVISLAQKMGFVDDWLTTPDRVRGLASFVDICGKVDGGPLNGGVVQFTMNIPKDSSYGTIFGDVCNDGMRDTCEMSNLASGTCSVIFDYLQGQALFNNVHFMCEDHGLLNTRLFGSDLDASAMFKSISADMGLFENTMQCPIVEDIFAQSPSGGLFGNPTFFSKLLSAYVRTYHRSIDETMVLVWPQINHIFGKVFDNNVTAHIGSMQDIGPSTIRTLINDPVKASAAMEWFSMHGFTKSTVIGGGLTHTGSDALAQFTQEVYNEARYMNGVYRCSWVGFSFMDWVPRSGYDSKRCVSAYNTLSYFSFDNGKKTGEDEYDGVLVDVATELLSERQAEIDSVSKEIGENAKMQIFTKTKRQQRVLDIASDNKTSLRAVGVRSDASAAVRENAKYAPPCSEDDLASMLESAVSDDVNQRRSAVVVGAKGDIRSLKVERVIVPGDGNCSSHVIGEFCERYGLVNDMDALVGGMGYIPNNEWQHDGYIGAMAQMLGCSAEIYTQSGDKMIKSTYRVDKPRGVMRVLKNGNHYDLLVPSEDSGMDLTEYPTEEYSICIATDEMPRQVAMAYREFVSKVARSAETVTDRPGAYRIRVDRGDEDVVPIYSGSGVNDERRIRRRVDNPLRADHRRSG